MPLLTLRRMPRSSSWHSHKSSAAHYIPDKKHRVKYAHCSHETFFNVDSFRRMQRNQQFRQLLELLLWKTYRAMLLRKSDIFVSSCSLWITIFEMLLLLVKFLMIVLGLL
ncbi:hypothetical protein [Virgibacillus siamensis]|uniref:hypothetical protein n=1 Tax=Virgibacillus siamensis TaxID=480071 RepID=UPI0009866FCD|nr:hypothetical protein [Virgibacillus siamensis]